ncbi:MAG: hypothetical protein UH241_09965, partial [Acutalibacteraceae bacterium]|nr:hypothetical protein [Acutalibacteraceae bacterium]
MNRIEGFFKKSTATVLSVLMMSSMVAVAGTATASAADTEKQQSTATVNWTDGSVLTEKKGLSVKAGDLVNLWVEVTIPESDCVIEGWTTDVYYDTNVFKVNTAFADGKMFAFGNEAVDYALGLSDTAVKFPGGGAMPQGNFETDGKITLADLALGGFDFEGKTTKQLCVQLIVKSTGTGNIGCAITDLVNEDLATVYVDQTTSQAIGGAKFALKTEILEGQAPTEAPTEKPTEAPTEKPTEKPSEVPTEEPTEKPTDAPVSQKQIYFVPTTDWAKDNARFSAYFFDGDKESTWVSLTATSDGKHAGVIPEGNYKSVIFVRMNPDTTANNWDNGTKWNQTADLTISGNCFTLTSSQWDGGNGTWSTIGDITIPTEKPTNPSGSKGKLYFIPSSNWKNNNARFAAYFFNNTTENEWVSLTLNDDGRYECAMPEKDYKQVIFVRMNPATTNNNWDNGTKWNQTADLTISGNCFTLTSTDWDLGNGTWSTIEEPTEAPTVAPTEAPTAEPTEKPTEAPTATPTATPTDPTLKTDGYYVVGDINLKLTACGTGRVRGTIALQPGTYNIKLNDHGTLLGYKKTVNNSSNG